ncbi:hypothetical protein V1514DRAFT_295826 [Lipomyces japonicus]|uniref:uncharacterized protein n=1 Tax=Lipomyces japonicus TaxID=56871 RepID=UPI0034CD0EF5
MESVDRVLNSTSVRNIRDSIQNVSLYDVKAYVRKAQNVMMNFTAIEAKVREATNNEPWGASSTLMQEIAEGTFNYSSFNEIMPMIYKRFTEKSASEWRQIYKALQLLEFLIKHGSERVVDDARAHVATISMLRSFHYTDSNGKDQGINVRNRSKELVVLLGDDDRIRTERKKARSAKSKYAGVASSDAGGFGGTGKKYGGFGSDSVTHGGSSDNFGGGGSSSGRVYGDGGGFGGESAAASTTAYYARDDQDRAADRFEEYNPGPSVQTYNQLANHADNHGDDDEFGASVSAAPAPLQSSKDLFSFDDDDNDDNGPANNATTSIQPQGTSNVASLADDDFDDFQSAPSVTTLSSSTFASSITTNTTTSAITDLFNAPSSFQQQPIQSEPVQSAFFTATPTITTTANTKAAATPSIQSSFSATALSQPNYSRAPSYSSPASTPAAEKKSDVFGSLWTAASSGVSKKQQESSLSSLFSSSTAGVGVGANASLGALAQQNAQAGIWDALNKPSSSTTRQASSQSTFSSGDLLS